MYFASSPRPHLGLYLHIPFCRHACAYCDFYFTLSGSKEASLFIEALIREAEYRRAFFKTLPVLVKGEDDDPSLSTLYLGGGTPSLLPAPLLKKLLNDLRSIFSLAAAREITLEANPEDLTEDRLHAWREAGVTRLSLGIQSFNTKHAKYLGRKMRPQTEDDWHKLLESIRRIGFREVSLDLIYGFPTLTATEWLANLNRSLALGVDHLSLYSLTLEAGTRLDKQIHRGTKPPLDDTQALAHFLTAEKLLREHGFIHYEISNFAKPGHFAKHNQSYWTGGAYLGLGPSAHSYDGLKTRTVNISNLEQYLTGFAKFPKSMTPHSLSEKHSLSEQTVLTEQEYFNDLIITRLRSMVTGLTLSEVEASFSGAKRKRLVKRAEPLIKEGLLKVSTAETLRTHYQLPLLFNDHKSLLSGETLVLTTRGSLFADRVMRELIE